MERIPDPETPHILMVDGTTLRWIVYILMSDIARDKALVRLAAELEINRIPDMGTAHSESMHSLVVNKLRKQLGNPIDDPTKDDESSLISVSSRYEQLNENR